MEREFRLGSRYMPAAVRRIVRRRDGNQCRFVNKLGRRCTERRGLEFHHHDPFGLGGDHDPDRISLRYRAQAERDYGEEMMNKYRRNGDRVSESPAVYALLPGPEDRLTA